jgi:hypothetical protein
MSDIVATAALVTAVLLLVKRHPVPAAAAATLAIWTRPPLLAPCTLAVLLLAPPCSARQRLRYLAVLFVGVAVLALLHWQLYGHPLRSGKGTAGTLFLADRFLANVANYAKWFSIVHTPLIYLALVAGLWTGTNPKRAERVASAAARPAPAEPFPLVSRPRQSWLLVAIFAAEAVPYLAYLEFDHWETLRYWLPALPFVLIVASVGVVRLLARVAAPLVLPAAVVAVAWLVAAGWFLFLQTTSTFHLWDSEQRFRMVANVVALHSTPRDVVLADVHGGSMRMYGPRLTVRWQAIPPDRLPATVTALARQGRRTLLVLDDWVEEELFRRRFGGSLSDLAIASEWRVRGVKVQRLVTKRPGDGGPS